MAFLKRLSLTRSAAAIIVCTLHLFSKILILMVITALTNTRHFFLKKKNNILFAQSFNSAFSNS